MHVTNLTSPRSGSPVANQFEITDGTTEVFQSYETPIARKVGYNYTISAAWCYSVTTTKYFNQWLRSYGWTDDEIKQLKKWLKQAKNGDSTAAFIPNVTLNYVDAL